MSKNNFTINFILFLVLYSCQKTNDFYSDPNDRNVERIKHTSTNYEIAISATGHDNYLEVLVNTTLLKNDITLTDLNLKINDLNISTIKKELCRTDGSTLYFKNFSELKNLEKINSTGYLIRFYFDNLNLRSSDDLNIDITIESNKGVFQKRFIMEKHSRYRIW